LCGPIGFAIWLSSVPSVDLLFVLGILLNEMSFLLLASFASLPASSFPYIPTWALIQANFIV